MIHLSVLDGVVRWGTNLEQTLAAAVKLHAEADAAGLTGAGELAEQGGEDGAGQCLLQQRGSCYHTGQITKSYTECASCGNAGPIPDYIIIPSKFWIYMCRTGKSTTLNILKKKKKKKTRSVQLDFWVLLMYRIAPTMQCTKEAEQLLTAAKHYEKLWFSGETAQWRFKKTKRKYEISGTTFVFSPVKITW